MDLLFFAIIAFFIGYKYYTILGKTDENNEDIQNQQKELRKRLNQELKVLDITANNDIELTEDLANKQPIYTTTRPDVISVIENLNSRNKEFSEDFFIKGATSSFEIIINAFNLHLIDEIEQLTSQDILQKFKENIESQQQQKINVKSTILRLNVEIESAKIENESATMVVKFNSEQIILTYDEEQKIISGKANKATKISDRWIFYKKLDANKSGWIITDIESLN